MLKSRILIAWVAAVTAPAALAQHAHEHGKPAEFKVPATYKEGVREIEHRLHEISELIGAKALDQVHAQAEVIQKVGKIVGQLAMKEDSGVPKEAVKEVNLAGKELAAKFDPIDKAGDSGNLAATKSVYEEMVKIASTLQKYAPKEYICPMRCEDNKTYAKPEKCPKCGMSLQDINAHTDHEPKHGGLFFMASDQKHHLEGTISESGEFRIYFYDEYTKPIVAEKFTAEGKAWPKGADETARKVLALSPAPDNAFLTGRVDASIKLPLSVKVFIDFKDGQKPQVFDFTFDEPSQEVHAERAGSQAKSGKDG